MLSIQSSMNVIMSEFTILIIYNVQSTESLQKIMFTRSAPFSSYIRRNYMILNTKTKNLVDISNYR